MLNKKAREAEIKKMVNSEFKVMTSKESGFQKLTEAFITKYLKII